MEDCQNWKIKQHFKQENSATFLNTSCQIGPLASAHSISDIFSFFHSLLWGRFLIDGLKCWRKMKYFELRVFCAAVQTESKALTLIKGSDVFPCCSGLHRSHLTPAPVIERSSQTWHRTIRMLWKLCNKSNQLKCWKTLVEMALNLMIALLSLPYSTLVWSLLYHIW